MQFSEFVEDKESNDHNEEEDLHNRFFADLRCLQSRSKCTEAICADIVSTFAKYMHVKPEDFRTHKLAKPTENAENCGSAMHGASRMRRMQ